MKKKTGWSAKKLCWLARHKKDGWKLYLSMGEQLEFPVKDVLFKTANDVKIAIKANIVFVEREQKCA